MLFIGAYFNHGTSTLASSRPAVPNISTSASTHDHQARREDSSSTSMSNMHDLPNELWVQIADKLTDQVDIAAFASACKSTLALIRIHRPHFGRTDITGLTCAYTNYMSLGRLNGHREYGPSACTTQEDTGRMLEMHLFRLFKEILWLFRERSPGRCISPECTNLARAPVADLRTRGTSLQAMLWCSAECMETFRSWRWCVNCSEGEAPKGRVQLTRFWMQARYGPGVRLPMPRPPSMFGWDGMSVGSGEGSARGADEGILGCASDDVSCDGGADASDGEGFMAQLCSCFGDEQLYDEL